MGQSSVAYFYYVTSGAPVRYSPVTKQRWSNISA